MQRKVEVRMLSQHYNSPPLAGFACEGGGGGANSIEGYKIHLQLRAIECKESGGGANGVETR